MKKNNRCTSFWIVVITGCILGIALYNIVICAKEFFSANVYQVISLLFVLFITFLLTQRKNDYRRKIDMLDKMVVGIQEDISHGEIVSYKTEEQRSIALLKQKSIANRIQYLKESKIHNGIEYDVDYIAKEMERLREFYGAHMDDINYMEKSSADFEKYIVNICDKCFSIRLKLYED